MLGECRVMVSVVMSVNLCSARMYMWLVARETECNDDNYVLTVRVELQ